jgi:plastocyanin
VTPNAGYSASVSEGSLSGTTWTISNVTSTHTATVTFSTNTYTVTASVVNSAGGSVSPASQTVNYGGTATFTVTTNSGYTASVSAGSLSGSTWTISNVTSNLSATITFTYSGGGGASGTKTNPIKINKPTTKVANGYIPSTSLDNSRGTYVIKAGQKVYFELDPLATTGRSVLAFGLQIKFYNQSLPVCKLIQDKTTGNYSTEVCRIGGYADIVYDNSPYEIDNTKFLYAIDNSSCTSSGVCDFTDDIWAEIP